MNNSATSHSNDNCPVQFIIICSDATRLKERFVFHQHMASSFLCQQLDLSSHQGKTEVSVLIGGLVISLHREVLGTRSWPWLSAIDQPWELHIIRCLISIYENHK